MLLNVDDAHRARHGCDKSKEQAHHAKQSDRGQANNHPLRDAVEIVQLDRMHPVANAAFKRMRKKHAKNSQTTAVVKRVDTSVSHQMRAIQFLCPLSTKFSSPNHITGRTITERASIRFLALDTFLRYAMNRLETMTGTRSPFLKGSDDAVNHSKSCA